MAEESAAPTEVDPFIEGLGLRERKRVLAMHRIQDVALDLFDAEGFDAVTIERIAADADVSPSSVYRYFGTKEGILLWDQYDPLIFARVLELVDRLPPLQAIRQVMATLVGEVFDRDQDRIRRRIRHMMAEPTVQAASALQSHQMAETIGELLAPRLGLEVHDLRMQVFAHTVVGAMVAGIHHWYATDFAEPFSDVLDRSLDLVAAGIELPRG